MKSQQKSSGRKPVSGITFYNSDSMPEWKGNLFICGLSSMQVTRLVIKHNKVAGEERLLEEEKKRFRAITEGKDGACMP